MKDQIKYWCAVSTVKQMAFREDGSIYEVDKESPVGEQHIVYQGVLMCGKSRDGIKGYRKTKKQKTVQLRIENVPLCKKCQEKYKANGNLSYVKWVQATELHGVKTTAPLS